MQHWHGVGIWFKFVLFACKLSGMPRSGQNFWKMIFFQAREKPGNFMDGQGHSEKTCKVSEKSEHLKINGYCSVQKIYLFCSRGKNALSREIVQAHLPLIRDSC